MRKNDRGFKNFDKNTRAAHGSTLQIGIFKKSIARKSFQPRSAANSLAYRYSVHDLGKGNNPKRETLNPAMRKAMLVDPLVRNFLAANLHRNRTFFNAGVKQVGARLSAAVKKEITALKYPKKKRETILAAQRRYGGIRQNPLIQTAEMRNAVTFRYNA